MNQLPNPVFFAPHPPIVVPEVGGRRRHQAKATIQALEQMGQAIAQLKPEVILVISPHGNRFQNGASLLYAPEITGDFSLFGVSDYLKTKTVAMDLTRLISEDMEAVDLENVLLDKTLCEAYQCKYHVDHGTLVPLHFVDTYYTDYDLALITPGNTSDVANYKTGMAIQMAIRACKRSVVVIASGDLSHALSDDGPYTFHPDGSKFDDLVVEALKKGNPLDLFDIDPHCIQHAAECGYGAFLMGFGCLDGYALEGHVYGYEGPFGVGYVVAKATLKHEKDSLLPLILEKKSNQDSKRHMKEDPYVQLARKALTHYLNTYEKLDIATLNGDDTWLNEALKEKAGVFVSLHQGTSLMGCMGTMMPVCDHVVDEIIYNAISAGTKDPRFSPVTLENLPDLSIHVDVLSPLESIDSIEALDPKQYGVMVEKDHKRGVLLPDLPGIETVEAQVSIAKQKAGIQEEVGVDLFRFTVKRYT